ncbi:MAG: PAS domain S-box protein [Bacteroidales bacterium]|nr:PAS domain S-box protein [Bacteroidales bacterium]
MSNKAKNILLVEDSKSQAALIKTLLEEHGYLVRIIPDGKEALEYITRHGSSLDLILMDYHLPSLDGLEILQRINLETRHPVIFMTSDHSIELAVKAMRAGAMDFIPKEKDYIQYLPDMVEKVYDVFKSLVKKEQIEENIKTKEFLEQLINGISDPFFVRDEYCRYIAVNESFCKLFKYKREDIIGKSVYDLFDKLKAQEIAETDGYILHTDSVEEKEEILRKEDSTKYISVKTSLVKSPQNEKYIVGTIRDITLLKQSEEALKKKNLELEERHRVINNLNANLERNRNRLKSILSIAPVGIAVLKDKTFQYVNERFEKLTGYTKEELLNQNDRLIYPSTEDYNKVQNEVNGKIYIHGSQTIQTLWRTKDEALKHILLNVSANDKNDLSKGVTIAALDITERILLEQNLKESQEKYLSLYNNSPDMYFSIDKDEHTILECNNTLLVSAGYDRIELVGKPLYELIDQENIEDVKAALTEYIASGYLKNNEFMLRTRHGIKLSVNMKISAAKGPNGEVQYYVLSCRDITEKKIVSNILRKKEQEFKVLIENTPDIIARFNKKLKCIYVNPAIEKELGILQKDMIGRTIHEIEIPKHTAKKMEDALKSVFQHGIEMDIEFSVPVSDQEVKTLYSRIVPEFSDESEVESVLSITRDISEFKRIQKELLSSKTKAEKSDKLKSAFLANMSHEIRTPMNAIIGFSELLGARDLSRNQQMQYINLIQSSGNNLLRLIDDIIDIAKIEAGELSIRKTECHIGQIMWELYYTYEEAFSASSVNPVEFRLNIPDSASSDEIISDPARLKQILSNLITNAMKFTDEGYIEIGYRFVTKNKVEFFVRDTGVGIEKEYLDIIFDRFRQIDNTLSRKHGGTGLGLTISKNMVKLLGGEIKVHSEIDKGSEFKFSIPIGTKIKEPPIKMEPKVVVNNDFPNWENKVILIAEDEDTNFTFLKEVLNRTNAYLLRAKTGTEAIELFKRNSIDIILMDIKLPEKNGLLATKEIRRKSNTVPIIAQTAYAMEEDREKCIQAGCNDYITKPIKQGILISALSKYMDNKVGNLKE